MLVVGCAVQRVAVVAGLAECRFTTVGVQVVAPYCISDRWAEMTSLPMNGAVGKFRNDRSVAVPFLPTRRSTAVDKSVVTPLCTNVSKLDITGVFAYVGSTVTGNTRAGSRNHFASGAITSVALPGDTCSTVTFTTILDTGSLVAGSVTESHM